MTHLNPQTAVVVYVRHRKSCREEHKGRKDFSDAFRRCECPKWLRYSRNGKQYRKPADTRTWGIAEEKAQALQKQLDGDAPTPIKITTQQKTIEESIETFIEAKEGKGVRPETISKLRQQCRQFEKFMSDRSKFFPSQITKEDVIAYRASWRSWKSGLTRQKAQQNLRGFLRFCNLPDLLKVLEKIQLSREDLIRLEPQPYTEKELKTLLAQIPKSFPETDKQAKVTALIHCMVSTGLAIRDAIQLEPKNVQDGWLRIRRQKTGRSVIQKIDDSLSRELMSIAKGNPKYIFWNGNGEVSSAVGMWLVDVRQLMDDSGLRIKGNLSHRFRDTFVNDALARGWTLEDVADAIGDTLSVTEKHYKSLNDKRREERLAKLPKREWNV